ncbi:MAG: DinB family protein [Phycisphaerales bacterium]|nr:DinB family protein [Phycisphaerales bacterium]
MNVLRTYDYLVLARGKVFDVVRPLSAEQYAREFSIGLGTLGRTLTHLMICEWFYLQRVERRTVPPYGQWPIRDEQPPPFAVLEEKWATQARETRAMLAAVRDWEAPIDYPALTDDQPPTVITASAMDIFTQLVLHEVHHRAQALNMLRQMGVTLGDIDFNALMYQRRRG